MTDHIPIIDFSKCGLLVPNEVEEKEISEAGRKIYEALSTVGFAYLSNSGMTSEMFKEVNEVTEKFFLLPAAEKGKYNIKSVKYGYDAMGVVRANPERPIDYHEGFRISGNAMIDENIIWPDIPGFREKLSDIIEHFKVLSIRILKSLGIGMQLKDPDYFVKAHETQLFESGGMTTMKTLYYPPILEDDVLQENQIRIGEHTDFDCLTLLYQDDAGGLQVQNLDGEFQDAVPIPNTFLLNVGDMLEFWSGGRLKSTIHRVIIPDDPEKRKRKRRSLGYYLMADDDVLLGELEFKNSDNKTSPVGSAPPMTSKQYVDKRFSELFLY